MANEDIPQSVGDKLTKFRQEIDAIDQQIISLLKRRIDIVRQVGIMKRTETELCCFIRSGREAEMIRDISKSFQGSAFHPVAAAAIWRQIIAASTHHEQPLTISLNTHSEELYWRAREYFGSFAHIFKTANDEEAIYFAESGKTNIAILPYPPANDKDCWWSYFYNTPNSQLRIFACLPFITETSIKALAMAKLIPEETSQDMSILTITTKEASDIDHIHKKLLEMHIYHKVLATQNNNALLELEGYIPPNHNVITQLKLDMSDKIRNIHWLGSYASPIQMQELEPPSPS